MEKGAPRYSFLELPRPATLVLVVSVQFMISAWFVRNSSCLLCQFAPSLLVVNIVVTCGVGISGMRVAVVVGWQEILMRT